MKYWQQLQRRSPLFRSRLRDVSRFGLVVVLAVTPVISAGVCRTCLAACSADIRCCSLDVVAAALNESGVNLPARADGVGETPCCDPLVFAPVGDDDISPGHPANNAPYQEYHAGCGCMFEPRDNAPASFSCTASTNIVCDIPLNRALSSLPDVGNTSAAIGGVLSLHLSYAARRPLRVLYGVWRN
jgi:hypothetical protein